jgi:hypothetical protein
MFNPIQVVIDAFVAQLQEQYAQVYGVLEPGYPGIIGSANTSSRGVSRHANGCIS